MIEMTLETWEQKITRESKEGQVKAEERRIAAWNKRKAMSLNKAIDDGLFGVECCMGCGKEAVRLYYQTEGTYAGNRYCRKCAILALMSEYF